MLVSSQDYPLWWLLPGNCELVDTHARPSYFLPIQSMIPPLPWPPAGLDTHCSKHSHARACLPLVMTDTTCLHLWIYWLSSAVIDFCGGNRKQGRYSATLSCFELHTWGATSNLARPSKPYCARTSQMIWTLWKLLGHNGLNASLPLMGSDNWLKEKATEGFCSRSDPSGTTKARRVSVTDQAQDTLAACETHQLPQRNWRLWLQNNTLSVNFPQWS